MKQLIVLLLAFAIRSTSAQVSLRAVNSSDSTILTKVETEPAFPGGIKGWQTYLGKTLRYPVEALDKGAQGTVNLQFVVEKDGSITNISVIDGPKELRQESVRVIRESGTWLPATQDGKPVRCYAKRPVKYKML